METLEENEAAGKLKWKPTHILSIGTFPTEGVLLLLQKPSADERLTGSLNPFYELYRNTRKRLEKRAREVFIEIARKIPSTKS